MIKPKATLTHLYSESKKKGSNIMINQENLQALVFAAKNGNDKSFANLYALYYEKIYALAQTTLKNTADAEDALQSTFIKAWQNLGTLEDCAAFHTWIQRIALNECYAILRKRKGNISLDDEDFQIPVSESEQKEELHLPQVYAERADLNLRLKQVIEQLSDVQRQSIMLYYFGELSVTEIAHVMNCSEGTVKSRLFLARKSIKTEIEEQERKHNERFYGVAGIPTVLFGKVFVAQVKGSMLTKGAAKSILETVLAQAAKGVASAPVAGGAASAAKAVAGTAAKAALPLSKKMIAIVLAATVAIGGTIGTIAFLRSRKKDAETTQSAIQTTAAEKSEKQQEPRKLVDATLGKNEKALTDFFTYYFQTCQEFDSQKEKLSDKDIPVRNTLSVIVGHPCAVDYSIYPVQEPVQLSDEAAAEISKKQGRQAAMVYEFDKESVYWVAQNIFNMEESTINTCMDALLEGNTAQTDSLIVSGTGDDGKEKYYVLTGGVGRADIGVDYTDIKTDGEKYYIKYNEYFLGFEENAKTYFALMELKTIDGKEYWTIYQNTEDIPEGIFDAEPTLDFSSFSGEYIFQGYGDRMTTITLHKDGSFEGEFSNFEVTNDADTIYYITYKAKFSGTFSDLKKTGDYSYTASLSDLTKEEIEPKREEQDDNSVHLVKQADALGIEGGKNFRFCVKGTPVDRLPNNCKQWLLAAIDGDDTVQSPCFYNEDSNEKYCFCQQQN